MGGQAGDREGKLTGLRPDARSVDDHCVAAFAQPTQQRFDQCGVAEEVLPGRIRNISFLIPRSYLSGPLVSHNEPSSDRVLSNCH